MPAQKIIAIVIAVIIIGGASFYTGTLYAKGNKSSNRNMPGFTSGIARGVRGNGNLVNGQILSMDSGSITIQIPNGGSKIIFLTATTPITKTVDGALSDLTVGQQIMATGTTNSDGSISAQSIQIRPNTPENVPPTPTD